MKGEGESRQGDAQEVKAVSRSAQDDEQTASNEEEAPNSKGEKRLLTMAGLFDCWSPPMVQYGSSV